MIRYEVTTDEETARDFLQVVQEALYRDEAAPDGAAAGGGRRRPMPKLDLFARRGKFIAAILAYDGDRLVGAYLLTDQSGKAHVDVGYVVSKYRHRGIGAEMLRRSCDYLLDSGRRPVYLDVRTIEMASLVAKLSAAVPAGTLLATVALDPAARDLKDSLYE